MSRKKKPKLDPAEATAADVEAVAVRLLARREHSRLELKRKLGQRRFDAALIGEVVDKLESERLQSDERFADSFVRTRAERGQGPVRIRAELAQRGVDDVEAETALAAYEGDWQENAVTIRRQRFGAELPETYEERARQARFLQQRGFAMEHIRATLKGDPDDF